MKTPDYSQIPKELTDLNSWVGYKLVQQENGKPKKIPKNPKTGRNAKCNDSTTWSDFDTACEAVNKFGLDGIGIMLGDILCGIDIDNCIIDGKASDFAKDIVKTMKSYTEYSPSGKGVHILFRGSYEDSKEQYYARNDNIGVELYKEGRFFTVTGKVTHDYPLKDCSKEVKVIREKYLKRSFVPIHDTAPKYAPKSLSNETLLRKAKNAKNGKLFSKLWAGEWVDIYPSQNHADLALCNYLAYWTGKDVVRMDKLFRSSGLMREKWNRDDYSTNTIKKACDCCNKVYIPSQSSKSGLRQNKDNYFFYNAQGRFQHNVLGDYIIDKYEIVKIEKVLHIYMGGLYIHQIRMLFPKSLLN